MMLVPIAAVLFVFGYVLQRGLINPFIRRPEHTQFLLLVALALIIANGLLIMFGPDARIGADVVRARQLPDRPADRRRYQGLCRRGRDRVCRRVVRVLSFHACSAKRSAPAPTIIPARWWSGSTSSGSTRSPSGSARRASAPPAR